MDEEYRAVIHLSMPSYPEIQKHILEQGRQ